MPDPQTPPSPSSSFSIRSGLGTLAILTTCLGSFGWNLAAEPHFVDESAYISQAFYFDLLVEGRRDQATWLDYAGYDLPPLPKYLIGGALWVTGDRRPTLTDARAWYANTSRQFVGSRTLVTARLPSVVLGAVGCVAVFWVGSLAGDARVGGLAAFLLAINPLYRLHARRAMSDAPAECFILLALAVSLVLWMRASRRRITVGWWLLVGVAGGLVGLATLSKLNGVLSGLVLVSWVGLALVIPTFPVRSKGWLALATALAAGVAFATFTVLDPFLTAHPAEPVAPEFAPMARLTFAGRVKTVYQHRESVSRAAMTLFPLDALPTLASRAAVVAAQGFGRFGPLGPPGRSDSTRRFDQRQDWGAVVWLPSVVAGVVLLARRGLILFRHQSFALPWLILAYFGVVVVVVTSFIPLAWDRYLMSIQPAASLVGASFLVACFDKISRRHRRASPEESAR